MAFVHGKSATVFVEGLDLTAYFRAFSSPISVDVADVSAFGGAAKKYITGMDDGTFSGDGIFDPVADEHLEGLLSGQGKIVAYFPNGDAIGNRGYEAATDETSFEQTVDIGDAVGFSFEGQATGGIAAVLSLLSGKTTISATGDQAISDGGAATTDGAEAFLQAVSKSGGTTADITLRHSTDNFVGDDTLLGTFAQVSASGVAEKLVITGTVKRYVRVAVALGGGGDWKFQVAIARG